MKHHIAGTGSVPSLGLIILIWRRERILSPRFSVLFVFYYIINLKILAHGNKSIKLMVLSVTRFVRIL